MVEDECEIYGIETFWFAWEWNTVALYHTSAIKKINSFHRIHQNNSSIHQLRQTTKRNYFWKFWKKEDKPSMIKQFKLSLEVSFLNDLQQKQGKMIFLVQLTTILLFLVFVLILSMSAQHRDELILNFTLRDKKLISDGSSLIIVLMITLKSHIIVLQAVWYGRQLQRHVNQWTIMLTSKNAKHFLNYRYFNNLIYNPLESL